MPPLLAAIDSPDVTDQAQVRKEDTKSQSKANFVVLNWNADGLLSQRKPKVGGLSEQGSALDRLQELRNYAEENRPSIMVITEPKLTYAQQGVIISVADGEIAIPGYQIFRVDRDLAKAGKVSGGGLVIYCKEELELVDEVRCQAADMEMFAANIPSLKFRLGDALHGVSDHVPVEAELSGPKIASKERPYWKRKWNEVKADDVQHILRRHGIHAETGQRAAPLSVLLAEWHKAWNEVKARLAPRILVTPRSGQRKLKRSPALRAAMKRRNRAQHAYLSNPTLELKMELQDAKRAARALRCDAQAAEVEIARREAGNDAAACWGLRKRLLGQHKQPLSQPAASVAEVNDFFVAKPQR
eukprot:gene5272-18846_t